MHTAAKAAVEVLAFGGVRRFYTVPGESFLGLIDAVDTHPALSLISTRQESGASFMAEADAKLSGVPAVAMATRGVGSANMAIGVHTAYQDSTPMVVLLGQVKSQHLHREAFQEVDLTAFYAPITKWSVTVSRADCLSEVVRRALQIATSGRPGPVMVAVPADLIDAEVTDTLAVRARPDQSEPAPSAKEIQELARRIANSERPVVIAGGGARNARQELVSLSEHCSLGVYAAFRRQDVFPNNHPLYLGHLGLGTPPETLAALKNADLVIVVGCRLSEITTQEYTLPVSSSDVVQIDIDPASVGVVVPVVQEIVADAGQALSALMKYGVRAKERSWQRAHTSFLEASTISESRSSGRIDPSDVIREMGVALPANAVLASDAGNFASFLHRYWRFEYPNTQLAPTSGAMGYALPAAIAASLVVTERIVVALAGDSGFLMTGSELETAVRVKAQMLIIVFRNGLNGTIAMHQARSFGHLTGVKIGDVDLASYARSFGAKGFTVHDREELLQTLESALQSNGVRVIDVVTDPELITPTSTLDEMKTLGTRAQN